ncbi:endonuclease/exonuclease/phosphatase family protein [Sediminibacter sp. Hel_I_10]|uniref:endonuclease/exonuclease/phosphatase family protein n=1 Tax=Sediminibacter sp. Hel_I_10 TaxID=1392490 RepID=UPI00047D3FF2|nr:endonuclease/exonuclease/phosphatase family protein [Sediminibacter sp. Hel_I_10]
MNKLAIVALMFVSLVSGQNISVMTYNIKLDYPKEGKNSWNNRQDFMMNQIKFHAPDIMGVQEALPNQMKDIDRLLPKYSFIGVGRDDGDDEGEYSAIFYNTETSEVLENGTFWLSETPSTVGMGWDAVCNRVCTYGLFKNNVTNQKFWVFNTHFDHVGEVARMESVHLILRKIKELNVENLPVVLTGDFNLEPNTKNIALITEELDDSKAVSDLSFGPEGTWNGFNFDQSVTRRIDYVFVSKSKISVEKYAVLSDSWDLKYPSDHLPVYVEFKINN